MLPLMVMVRAVASANATVAADAPHVAICGRRPLLLLAVAPGHQRPSSIASGACLVTAGGPGGSAVGWLSGATHSRSCWVPLLPAVHGGAAGMAAVRAPAGSGGPRGAWADGSTATSATAASAEAESRSASMRGEGLPAHQEVWSQHGAWPAGAQRREPHALTSSISAHLTAAMVCKLTVLPLHCLAAAAPLLQRKRRLPPSSLLLLNDGRRRREGRVLVRRSGRVCALTGELPSRCRGLSQGC